MSSPELEHGVLCGFEADGNSPFDLKTLEDDLMYRANGRSRSRAIADAVEILSSS